MRPLSLQKSRSRSPQLVLEHYCLQYRSRALAGMLGARSDSAGIFFSGRGCTTILDRKPESQRAKLLAYGWACGVERAAAHFSRNFPSLLAVWSNLLDV